MKDYKLLVENLPESQKIELRKYFHKYSTLSEESKYRALYYLSKTL